jgi:hypothetical protein
MACFSIGLTIALRYRKYHYAKKNTVWNSNRQDVRTCV